MTLITASGCRKGNGGRFHNPRPTQRQNEAADFGPLQTDRPQALGRFNRPWISVCALADLHINAAFGDPVYLDLFARVVAGQIETR